MHYLIITSEFPPGPGGIGKHAYCMAKALMHNNVEVTVVCNMDYAKKEEIALFLKALPKGIHVKRIRRNGWITYVNRIKTVLNLCQAKHFDKIIVTGQFSLWLGWWLKRKYKTDIHVAGFVHGSELFIGGGIKQKLTRRSLDNLDTIYAVSDYTARLIRKSITGTNIKVLSNGIDISEWENVYDIPPFDWKGYPKLLTVGSVSKRKGQHNLISALPEIIQRFPDVRYHIVGMNPDTNDLEKLILDLKLQNHVTIHGKLSDHDLKRVYKSADIFCMLSEHTEDGDTEGFGIAILEANINGLPAIGSNDTGTADAIKQGSTGYTVNSKDPSDIIYAIEKIVSSDRIAVRQNCVSWAREHNWNNIAKQLL